jgi:hypothetical protein
MLQDNPKATMTGTQSGEHSNELSGVLVGLIAFVSLWVTILLHEGAHYGMAALLAPPGAPRGLDRSLITGSGPVSTLVIILVGAIAAGRVTSEFWKVSMFAAVWGAASRVILVAPGTLLGTAGNDETTIAPVLGVSARSMVLVELLVMLAGLYLVHSAFRRNGRIPPLRVVLVALLVGWFTAPTFGRAIGLPI